MQCRATVLPPLLIGLCAVFAQSGFAEEATEEDSAAEEDVGPVEEIVVTGSRIRRDEFSSASPITVITSETSALAGLLNTADILQTTTVATGQQIDNSFSGFVTDGGPGARSISLRGLGAQRTLVLVNGKRWGPSGSAAPPTPSTSRRYRVPSSVATRS